MSTTVEAPPVTVREAAAAQAALRDHPADETCEHVAALSMRLVDVSGFVFDGCNACVMHWIARVGGLGHVREGVSIRAREGR